MRPQRSTLEFRGRKNKREQKHTKKGAEGKVCTVCANGTSGGIIHDILRATVRVAFCIVLKVVANVRCPRRGATLEFREGKPN